MRGFWLAVLVPLALPVAGAAVPGPAGTEWHLPAPIEAVQAVPVRHAGEAVQQRGVLYISQQAAFTIRKGERFLMVKVGTEGGCRIEIGKHRYDVSSCPWLEGFTDHQTDFFKVIR